MANNTYQNNMYYNNIQGRNRFSRPPPPFRRNFMSNMARIPPPPRRDSPSPYSVPPPPPMVNNYHGSPMPPLAPFRGMTFPPQQAGTSRFNVQPPLPPKEVKPPPPPADGAEFIRGPYVPYYQHGYFPRGLSPNPRYQRNHQTVRPSFTPRPKFIAPKVKEGENGDTDVRNIRKRPLSKSYPSKASTLGDIAKALACEEEHAKTQGKNVVIKFPEPDITMDMVKEINPAFVKVHFQVPSNARYCIVTLKHGENVEDVINKVNETDFLNMGKLTCTLKAEKPKSIDEHVDPYTLYVGNLPINIIASDLKEKFPSSQRIDIGFGQKMKQTRYAFIRFLTVEDAIEAYGSALNVKFDSRTSVVRFFRKRNIKPSEVKDEVKLTKKQRKEAKKLLAEKHKTEKILSLMATRIKKESAPDDVHLLPEESDNLFNASQIEFEKKMAEFDKEELEYVDDEYIEEIDDEDSDDEEDGLEPVTFFAPNVKNDNREEDDDDEEEDFDDGLIDNFVTEEDEDQDEQEYVPFGPLSKRIKLEPQDKVAPSASTAASASLALTSAEPLINTSVNNIGTITPTDTIDPVLTVKKEPLSKEEEERLLRERMAQRDTDEEDMNDFDGCDDDSSDSDDV